MKKILVSGNRPCFCNSNRKFKSCHGFLTSEDILDTYKLHFLLKDVYKKVLEILNKENKTQEILHDFKIFNKIPKERTEKHELTFIFIDFLLFRAKDKNSGKSIYEKIIKSDVLSSYEISFLEDLKKSALFSIYRVKSVSKKDALIELENIFDKEIYSFYDKNATMIVEENGLVYGRVYEIFGRKGILPTFNYKKAELVKDDELDKIVKSFFTRYENLKENDSSLVFKNFIDSIEHEIYGGENPYEIYHLDEKFEKYQKEHPNKTFDDFLDEIEDEILGI